MLPKNFDVLRKEEYKRNATLFLIAPITGKGSADYLHIIESLSENRNVIVINSPLGETVLPLKLASENELTVEKLAEYYANQIKEFQPQGPYDIGGWSFGGLLAVRIAEQLELSDKPRLFPKDEDFKQKTNWVFTIDSDLTDLAEMQDFESRQQDNYKTQHAARLLFILDKIKTTYPRLKVFHSTFDELKELDVIDQITYLFNNVNIGVTIESNGEQQRQLSELLRATKRHLLALANPSERDMKFVKVSRLSVYFSEDSEKKHNNKVKTIEQWQHLSKEIVKFATFSGSDHFNIITDHYGEKIAHDIDEELIIRDDYIILNELKKLFEQVKNRQDTVQKFQEYLNTDISSVKIDDKKRPFSYTFCNRERDLITIKEIIPFNHRFYKSKQKLPVETNSTHQQQEFKGIEVK